MGQNLSKIRRKKPRVRGSTCKNLVQHGGILLEKQLALNRGRNIGPGQLKFYSAIDIAKATNGYDPNLIVGSVRSSVYKGTLDDIVVAIKVVEDYQQNFHSVDLYLTEAAAGMVMDHVNIAKLYGCCLENSIPILVYEFLSNGSLAQRLYSSIASIRWSDRVRVATDAAYALSYMHNALPKPVVHRDFQPSNIRIDDSFRGKLSNFGYSVSITPGDTSQTWPVCGTIGYIDPEYIETGEVTDKCDVYSFGVVLLELLARRPPYLMGKGEVDLVDEFVAAGGNDCRMKMIDSEVLKQASKDEIVRVERLVLTCLAKKGIERPTMVEVVKELWLIQGRGHS